MYQNKVFVIGNLTRQPEMKRGNGTDFCGLNIAVNSVYYNKDTGQKEEQTEFISVVVFGKIAENCVNYLEKGQKVFIEGRIKNRVEEKEGSKVYHTGIVADRVQFGSKTQSNNSVTTTQERGIGSGQSGIKKEEPVNKEFEYPTDNIDPSEIPF